MIYDQPERVGEWVRQRVGHVRSWGPSQAIGLEKDGELIAGVVFNFYSGCDIAMHVASVPGKRWMTKEYLKACFAYPFITLGVRRITGYVPAKSKDVLAFDEHLGFKREGLMRDALPDDDVVILGMTRKECRFV